MFEDFKAFKKAGLVLVNLHVNYEQVQPYEGCTVSGFETKADDLLATSSKELKGNRGDRRDRGARKNIGGCHDDVRDDSPLKQQVNLTNRCWPFPHQSVA